MHILCISSGQVEIKQTPNHPIKIAYFFIVRITQKKKKK